MMVGKGRRAWRWREGRISRWGGLIVRVSLVFDIL
jgi:hypothetical protein